MPGFNVCGQGKGPSAVIEPRRKHRWAWTVLGRGTSSFSEAELLVLMSASRPQWKTDIAEMHHNQEMARFAGKHSWEPITLKWYDIEQSPDVSAGVYAWIETVVNLASANVNVPSYYKRQSKLQMHNGSGISTEEWSICNGWPSTVNWGELDYVSNEIATIEATLVFDRATRSCSSAPQPQQYGPSCGFNF